MSIMRPQTKICSKYTVLLKRGAMLPISHIAALTSEGRLPGPRLLPDPTWPPAGRLEAGQSVIRGVPPDVSSDGLYGAGCLLVLASSFCPQERGGGRSLESLACWGSR